MENNEREGGSDNNNNTISELTYDTNTTSSSSSSSEEREDDSGDAREGEIEGEREDDSTYEISGSKREETTPDAPMSTPMKHMKQPISYSHRTPTLPVTELSRRSTRQSLIQIDIRALLKLFTNHSEIDDSLDKNCKSLISNFNKICISRTPDKSDQMDYKKESMKKWREDQLITFSKLVYEFISKLGDLYNLNPRDVIISNEKLFGEAFEIYIFSVISKGYLVNASKLAGSINGNNLILKFGDNTSSIELKKPNTPDRARQLATSNNDELDLEGPNLDTLLDILEEEIFPNLTEENDKEKELKKIENLIIQHINEVIINRNNEVLKESIEVTQMNEVDPHKHISSSDPYRSILLLLRDSAIRTNSLYHTRTPRGKSNPTAKKSTNNQRNISKTTYLFPRES